MHAIAAGALGVFLAAVGVAHFAVPKYFRDLVPAGLPAAALVAASGFVEVAVGVGLVLPRTRAVCAWLATAMLAVYVLVWAQRLRLARAGDPRPMNRPPAVLAALVVNVGYLAWATAVAI